MVECNILLGAYLVIEQMKKKKDREVAELIAKTNREAQEITAEGKKQAAKIYNESYGKDAEFFKFYTTINSYKTSIDGETTIMIPIDSLYLKYLMGS